MNFNNLMSLVNLVNTINYRYILRSIKKIVWFIDSSIAEIIYPIDNKIPYVGITGTDGKTTTCLFAYEIAKQLGYRPLAITTVGVKFDDKFENLDIKSTSFISFSLKNIISSIKELNFKKFIKNILFLDKENYKKNKETHRTTPLASEIRRTIIEYRSKGANFIIIECTSHALDQYRLKGIKFDSVGYTNITDEHIDYHGSWQNYANAKLKLVKLLKKNGSICINYDDKRSYNFISSKLKKIKINKIRYYIKDKFGLNINKSYLNIEIKNDYIDVYLSPYKIKKNSYKFKPIKLDGLYNLYNSLTAFCIFYPRITEDINLILEGLSKQIYVPGRMEILNEKPKVIVDFAHTPNAMENVLSHVKQNFKYDKLWVIFGCAGERYKEKRPEMGKIVYKYADRIIIAPEDSRNEDLQQINDQIISGIMDLEKPNNINIFKYSKNLCYDPNLNKIIIRFDNKPNVIYRKRSIEFALKNASKNDIVMILGKGHETTMTFCGHDYDWNDIMVTKKILSKLKLNNTL